MTKPPLAPETAELLAAIVPPAGSDTSAATDRLYELVRPVHDVLEHVEDVLRAVDRKRRAADATETQEYGYAYFERIKQTVAAADRQLKEAMSAIDALTDTFCQLDRYAREMDAALDNHQERIAAGQR